MQLEKFYVDVVDLEGRGCIGYAARLDGFGVAATIAATLRWDEAQPPAVSQQRTIRGRLPAFAGERLSWQCPAIGVAGTWAARAPASPEQTLWSDHRGSVRWQVLAPRAAVELRAGDLVVAGWGYAEVLRLDVPPWQLPLDGLHWGRFVSAEQSVVWIVWDHASPRRWLWHNGVNHDRFAVSETEIVWPGGALRLGARRRLRGGRLADTVFAGWPRVRRWLPAPIQAFEETKWCIGGVVTAPGRARTAGWVIAEHVRFR